MKNGVIVTEKGKYQAWYDDILIGTYKSKILAISHFNWYKYKIENDIDIKLRKPYRF